MSWWSGCSVIAYGIVRGMTLASGAGMADLASPAAADPIDA